MTTALICLTELAKNALGIATAILFLRDVFGYETRVLKLGTAAVCAVAAAGCTLPFVLSNSLSDAADIADIVTLFCFITFPYLIFKPRKKFTFLLFGIILNSTADFAVLIVTSAFVISSHTVTSLLYCGIYAACVLTVCTVKAQKSIVPPKNFFENIPTAVYVVILIADLSTYYTVSLTSNSEYIKDVSNFLMILSAVLVVTCIAFIIFRYYTLSDRHRETEMMLSAQLQHNEHIMQHNADIRRFRHDYTNNIFALKLLLEQNMIEEAKEYIAKMNDLPALTETRYATGNYLADAIITAKAADAAEKNIRIEFNGTIPYARVSNNDICTILTNVLDNAIAASPRDSLTPIALVSKESDSGLLLTVTNPVAQRVEIVNNSVKTSKKDKTNHGFGISNVKAVAKRHNGYIKLNCDDSVFTTEIGLVYKSED